MNSKDLAEEIPIRPRGRHVEFLDIETERNVEDGQAGGEAHPVTDGGNLDDEDAQEASPAKRQVPLPQLQIATHVNWRACTAERPPPSFANALTVPSPVRHASTHTIRPVLSLTEYQSLRI